MERMGNGRGGGWIRREETHSFTGPFVAQCLHIILKNLCWPFKIHCLGYNSYNCLRCKGAEKSRNIFLKTWLFFF